MVIFLTPAGALQVADNAPERSGQKFFIRKIIHKQKIVDDAYWKNFYGNFFVFVVGLTLVP